jgi:hypothetical protein
VLVVLQGPVQPGREIRRMGRVRTALGLEYERPLSLLPVSASEYQNRSSTWLQNVHQEGMPLRIPIERNDARHLSSSPSGTRSKRVTQSTWMYCNLAERYINPA